MITVFLLLYIPFYFTWRAIVIQKLSDESGCSVAYIYNTTDTQIMFVFAAPIIGEIIVAYVIGAQAVSYIINKYFG